MPTTSTYTGTGYIAGSSATLQSGATFVTQVEIILPPDSNPTDAIDEPMWTAQNITIAGQKWTGTLSGTRTTQNATAPYLSTETVAGRWSITAPTITRLSDGGVRVTGTITYTTTVSSTVTQRAGTTKYYGQTEFMPATIQVVPSYGWTSFSLTSSVQSATITYTGQPAGMASSTTLTNQLLTTSTLVNRSC